MARLRICMEEEELEVNQLAKQETEVEKGELFDSLYQQSKIDDEAASKIEKQKEEENATDDSSTGGEGDEPPEDDSFGDLSGDGDNPDEDPDSPSSDEDPTPTDDKEGKTDKPSETPKKDEEPEKKPEDKPEDKPEPDKTDDKKAPESSKDDKELTAATESCVLYHGEAMHTLRVNSVAMEGEYSEWMRQQGRDANDWIKGKAIQGLHKAGELGPKAVYASGRAVKATVKAMVKGTLAIGKFIKKRMESYQSYRTKIENAKKFLSDVSSDELKDGALDEHAEKLIRRIKIGNKFDPIGGCDILQGFMTDYYTSLKTNVLPLARTIERLIDEALKDRIATPKLGKSGSELFKGMAYYKMQDYKPDNESLAVYQYSKTLPGDVLFMAFLPDDSEPEPGLYGEAKTFFGLNTKTAGSEATANYLSKDELSKLLDGLGKICDQGLQTQSVIREIEKCRDNIQKLLISFDKKIFKEEVEVDIGRSVAKFATPYLAFLDRMCIAGPVAVDEYAQRYLHAAMDLYARNT